MSIEQISAVMRASLSSALIWGGVAFAGFVLLTMIVGLLSLTVLVWRDIFIPTLIQWVFPRMYRSVDFDED